MEIAIQVVQRASSGDDRAATFATGSGHVIVVADGAGGTAGGANAAEFVIDAVRAAAPASAEACASLLLNADSQLERIGQTTAVVIVIVEGQIVGASVGDSEAWLVDGPNVNDLTAHQTRKPLLGSGRATPIEFGPIAIGRGRLLIGTDGLFKYVPQELIREVTCASSIRETAVALVDAARLRGGTLQDDVAVIVVG